MAVVAIMIAVCRHALVRIKEDTFQWSHSVLSHIVKRTSSRGLGYFNEHVPFLRAQLATAGNRLIWSLVKTLVLFMVTDDDIMMETRIGEYLDEVPFVVRAF